MIRINLLAAHEVRKEKKQPGLLQGTILASALLFGVIIIVYWILGKQIQLLKKEKGIIEQQTRAAATLQKEIKELKEIKETAQNRLTLLQNLEKDRHGPVQLMEHIATTLPINQLWLTTLKENGPEIRIDGISLSNEILAEYMKRLEASPLIRQVDLIQSLQTVYKDLKVKQFTLTARIKEKPPDFPVEKK